MNMAAGQAFGGDAVSVTGRQVARRIPKAMLDRISSAETVRAFAMVNDKVVGRHRVRWG